MPESDSSARIVLTTVANPEEAARLGRILVEERLAACATLIPAIRVHLPLAGPDRVVRRNPPLDQNLLRSIPALEARLHELHSYQTPEFLVLAVESGSHPYLAWLDASLREGSYKAA